ncbi:hypothetical protein GOP47_0010615 [Adiantum capillus-veneris]|uniref:X8 domain-containing protein n=1 Tax=Adiantum capillus-veneris TaxID=13818 RepID=A0A9D4UVM5_ADICA|nr:hypothetical protein GOP47_0010615 [Adiantum capillus-veneris]
MAFHVATSSCGASCRVVVFVVLLAFLQATLLQVAEGRSPSLGASNTPNELAEDRKMATTLHASSYYDASNDGQKVWCVGKPAAEDTYLRKNIDYACGQEGVDCRLIQQGASCFLPNTPIAHASFAMNLYYQKHGRNWWNCHFNNTGLVVFTDPSFGNCKYSADWGI